MRPLRGINALSKRPPVHLLHPPEHSALVLPAGHKVLPHRLVAPHRQVWVLGTVEVKIKAGAAGLGLGWGAGE